MEEAEIIAQSHLNTSAELISLMRSSARRSQIYLHTSLAAAFLAYVTALIPSIGRMVTQGNGIAEFPDQALLLCITVAFLLQCAACLLRLRSEYIVELTQQSRNECLLANGLGS